MENVVNYDKVREMMTFYNNLSERERIAINNKISSVWMDVIYEDFAKRCNADVELNNAYDELKKIERILSFELSDHFRKYVKTINECDPEFADDIYEYSPEQYQYAKELSNNWEKVKADIEQNIEKEKNKKFLLFKKSRLEKLEEDLYDKTKMVELFKRCEKQQAEKEFYLSRKDYVEQLKRKCNGLTRKHAEEAVFNNVKEHPSILCVKHTGFISSSKYRSYNSEVLNNVCNEIRDEIIFSLKPSHDNNELVK